MEALSGQLAAGSIQLRSQANLLHRTFKGQNGIVLVAMCGDFWIWCIQELNSTGRDAKGKAGRGKGKGKGKAKETEAVPEIAFLAASDDDMDIDELGEYPGEDDDMDSLSPDDVAPPMLPLHATLGPRDP